jgi:hypothetical protein
MRGARLRFDFFTGFLQVSLTLALCGCAGVTDRGPPMANLATQPQDPAFYPHLSQSPPSQTQWLKRNFPDHEAYFDALPAARAFFRNDVLAGRVKRGMSVDEALITLGIQPYGPKSYKGKFWCDNQRVTHCNSKCNTCNAILIADNRVIFFSGNHQAPTVKDIDENSGSNSIFQTRSHTQRHRLAEALYRNKIVIGMSLHDMRRILGAANAAAQSRYSCDNHLFPPHCLPLELQILQNRNHSCPKFTQRGQNHFS